MDGRAGGTPAGERLAKVIARAGLCSRRDAEDWIRAGRVSVNGAVIRTPAFNVMPKDAIRVDGEPLVARSGTRLWLYHKPPGLVVTEKDPEGRPTIFEALEEQGLPRVLTVGRLDLNTEGLLLLTNDGGLKRVLELPSTGWLRRYRVRAFGKVTQAQLDGLKAGIEVEGVKYGPIEAELERQQGSNVWLVVALREGKNREVKNVLASLGLQVNRLIRVSYGPFQLGDMPVGAVEAVRSRVLRDQLGQKLAAAAKVDFESDVPEVAASRAERRPPDRSRKPAGRPGERARRPAEEPKTKPRRIFFDDGRPPEEYVPKESRPKRGDERGPSRGGKERLSSAARPAAGRRPPARNERVDRSRQSETPERTKGPRREPGPQPGSRPRAPLSAAGERPERNLRRRRPALAPWPAKGARPGKSSTRPRPAGPGGGRPRPGGRSPRKPRT